MAGNGRHIRATNGMSGWSSALPDWIARCRSASSGTTSSGESGELLEPEPERLGELRAEPLEREDERVPGPDRPALDGAPGGPSGQVVHEPPVHEPEQVVPIEEGPEQRVHPLVVAHDVVVDDAG